MSYRLGIDVGGTNTDAVVVDASSKIKYWTKETTTPDIVTGVGNALASILEIISPEEISEIALGTTHALNALLEEQDLFRVGVIRLAGHIPTTLPTCWGWPETLKEKILVATYTLNGGFECNGDPITPILEKEIEQALNFLIEKGAESIAVTGTFSPLNPSQEILVQELLRGRLPISLSSQIGKIGFYERENATILNAALIQPLAKGFANLATLLQKLGINAPLWITQNNGSLLPLEEALKTPILTLSSGPTNSFIGATRLAGLEDAIVVDIGGTSTDIGIVRKGYGKRARSNSSFRGIRLNFSAPDLLSLPLGGGSLVSKRGEIGPKSVASTLVETSLSFGGDVLTLTDLSLKAGLLSISDVDLARVPISATGCKKLVEKAFAKIFESIEKASRGEGNLPTILIGGGAKLFPQNHSLILPDYGSVANAYGAALAEISGTIDKVVSLKNRDNTIQKLIEEAKKQAINRGADPTKLSLINQEILPYPYAPNQLARVSITISGPRKQTP